MSGIWNASQSENRNRTTFPKSGPLGNKIVLPSNTPQPATASPTPLSSAEPETRVQTLPKSTLPYVHTSTIPKAAEAKEAKYSTSEIKEWEDNEPLKLGSDAFVITQPTSFTPTALALTTRPGTPIPVDEPEKNEEMFDHFSRPTTSHGPLSFHLATPEPG